MEGYFNTGKEHIITVEGRSIINIGCVAMLDLAKVALRLDDEEKLKVRYKFPQRTDGGTSWIVRCSKLLDVEQEGCRLFVSQDDGVVWVDVSEAIEILPDDGVYD